MIPGIPDWEDLGLGNQSILDEAAAAVNGARNEDYGHPLDNHSRTAALWSTYVGVPLTAEQVCFMNILQKVSRSVHRPTRDTLVDIAGYAENIERTQAERTRRAG